MADEQSLEFKIEFIKQLGLGINISRIYPKGHPSLEPVVQRIKILLKEIPLEQESVSLVVVEDVIMIGEQRFDSKRLPLIKSLVDRFAKLNVKSITFDVNATEDEIRAFFLAMAATPADIADYGDIVALVRAKGIPGIKINKFRVGVVSSEADDIKQMDWTTFLESLVISQERWTDEDRLKHLGEFLTSIGVMGGDNPEVQTKKVVAGLEKLAAMITDQYGEERWDEYAVIFSRMLALLSPNIKKNIARYKTENKKLALLFKGLIPTMADEDIIDIIATRAKEKTQAAEDEIVEILKNITGTRLPDILSSIRINIPDINFEKVVARLMSEMKAAKGTDVADKIMEKNLEQQMRSFFPQLRDSSLEVRAKTIDSLMNIATRLFDSKNYDLIRLLVDRFDTMSDTEEDLGVFKKIMDGIKELYMKSQKYGREELVQFISKKFSRHLVRKEKSLLDKKHIVIKTIADLKDQNYLPELVSLLWDQGSFSEARDALIAMAEYSTPMLINTLTDADDRTVRMKIIDVLVRIGEIVVPEAIRLLTAKEWFVRRNGVFILGEIKSRSALPHLERMMKDPEEKVQLATIESLVKIGSDDALQLVKLGLESPYRSVVIAAMKHLPKNEIGDRIVRVATWVKERKSIPDEKEELFRRSVIEVLGEKGDDTIIGSLVEVLEERALFRSDLLNATKTAALNAIARIGSEKAMQVLNSLTNHKDQFIATKCRELLKSKKTTAQDSQQG